MPPKEQRSAKRTRDSTSPPKAVTDAAKFNAIVLKKLQKAFEDDQEVDLISTLPSRYSERLSSRKLSPESDTGQNSILHIGSFPNVLTFCTESHLPFLKNATSQNGPENDIFTSSLGDSFSIVHPLSATLMEFLGTTTGLSQTIAKALRTSQVIWRSPVDEEFMILKLNSTIVIKTIRDNSDLTEYTTLQYLHQFDLDIPAPKPHGVIYMGSILLMFTSLIPGITLEKAWPLLNESGKAHIRDQLDTIFCNLRALPFPNKSQLGGVCQEGCKDLLRHVRRSEGVIQTAQEFEDFKFSRPNFGSYMFIQFLGRLAPAYESEIVFTHGDVRPDNIIVEAGQNGRYSVTGILDWEFSGFYPEYHESTKLTNCLSPNDKSD
ncbi:hypothetical protein EJ08DRAFT_652991 [Tothia fuscella]|uniref:Aminoglycoside phosphotransferase domain-containing protein n=1 Tax=Tothia fuscella TaxID=1048955 RepID=A0A9P4TUH5_9PEZI|nr:hypothetical protein EJ08DRAFT_652991 [Tothia fuscella]